jgi:hypothetical protein
MVTYHTRPGRFKKGLKKWSWLLYGGKLTRKTTIKIDKKNILEIKKQV